MSISKELNPTTIFINMAHFPLGLPHYDTKLILDLVWHAATILNYHYHHLYLTFNLGQNISNLFHLLAQFLFTTSETKLDYYHQKINVRVALQVAEQLKTLRNFKKNPEMLEVNGENPTGHSKDKFWRFQENIVKNQL